MAFLRFRGHSRDNDINRGKLTLWSLSPTWALTLADLHCYHGAILQVYYDKAAKRRGEIEQQYRWMEADLKNVGILVRSGNICIYLV